jgi:hypothetical protein
MFFNMVSIVEFKNIIFIAIIYKASHILLLNDEVMNLVPKFVIEVVCDKNIVLS